MSTRREFLTTAGGATGAAAAFAAAGVTIPSTQAKEKGTVSDHTLLSKVNCFSEDGELKEVIFGRIDDFRLPKYHPIFDFTGPKLVGLMKKSPEAMFNDADPEWYKKAHDSIAGVVDFLKGRGIVVHRPREHTKDEFANYAPNSKLNVNLYNRDSLVTIGNTLVETAFMTPERLRNKNAVRYVSMGLLKAGNRVISMPQPLDTYEHNEEESPLIEGGDVEVGDGHIYVGNSGEASNDLGYLWLKNAFPDWKVHQIKISTKRFPHQHLDCVMVMFSKWGMILSEDIVGGYEGLTLEFWSGNTKTAWKKQSIPAAGIYGFNFKRGSWTMTELKKGKTARPAQPRPRTTAQQRIVRQPVRRLPINADRARWSPLARVAWFAGSIYQFVRDEQDRDLLRELLIRGREEDLRDFERWLDDSDKIAIPHKEELREAYEELKELTDEDWKEIETADEADWEQAKADLGDLISADEWKDLSEDFADIDTSDYWEDDVDLDLDEIDFADNLDADGDIPASSRVDPRVFFRVDGSSPPKSHLSSGERGDDRYLRRTLRRAESAAIDCGRAAAKSSPLAPR